MLKENLKNVQNNIKKACERVGRKPEEVTLVAVSKMKPLSDIEELLETGQLEYGENYVQELCDKYENISKPVHWHMIGHLQTNKVKYIIDKVSICDTLCRFCPPGRGHRKRGSKKRYLHAGSDRSKCSRRGK